MLEKQLVYCCNIHVRVSTRAETWCILGSAPCSNLIIIRLVNDLTGSVAKLLRNGPPNHLRLRQPDQYPWLVDAASGLQGVAGDSTIHRYVSCRVSQSRSFCFLNTIHPAIKSTCSARSVLSWSLAHYHTLHAENMWR